MSDIKAGIDFATIKKKPIVEVEWIDSYSSHGWQKTADHRAPRDSAAACRTVGYLTIKDSRTIGITNSMSGGDYDDCTQFIPRRAVLRLRKLK